MKGGPKSSLRPFLHRAIQLIKVKYSTIIDPSKPRTLISCSNTRQQKHKLIDD